MKLSSNGAAVIKHYESCRLQAYPDPGSKRADGGPWTIGWGHTGPEVKQGVTWTQEKADAQFLIDIVPRENAVSRHVTVKLAQGQFDALVSLVYNIGETAFANSTLLKQLNQGNYASAQGQFSRWNKNDGNVMRGLVRRRASEALLFAGNDASAAIRLGEKAA